MENTIYIRLRHKIEVKKNEQIRVKDLATILASNGMEEVIGQIPVHTVTEEDKNIIVIDGMKVIAVIKSKAGNLNFQLIGPEQTLAEVILKKKKGSTPLFLLVWFLLFIGSGITIMNFHEDVSMQMVHQKLYYLLTGIENPRPLLFQIPYSIGLGAGMILFFNHIFKKRINEEPSPLEVEVFNYQEAVNRYLMVHENDESVKKLDDF